MLRSQTPRRPLGAPRPLRFEACEPRLVLDGQGFELTGLFFDVASLQPTDGGLVLTPAEAGSAIEELPISNGVSRIPAPTDTASSLGFSDVGVWLGGGDSAFAHSRFEIGLTDAVGASREGDDTVFPPGEISGALNGTSSNGSLSGNANTGTQSSVATPGAFLSFANDDLDIRNHATGYLEDFRAPERLGRLPSPFETRLPLDTGLPSETGLPAETGVNDKPNDSEEAFAPEASPFDTAVIPLAPLLADVPNTDALADAAPAGVASADPSTDPSTATGRLLLLAGQTSEQPSEPTQPPPANPVGLARAWAFDVAALDTALAERPIRGVDVSSTDVSSAEAQAQAPNEPLRSASIAAPGWLTASLSVAASMSAVTQAAPSVADAHHPDGSNPDPRGVEREAAFADSPLAAGAPLGSWSTHAAGLTVSTIALLALDRARPATADERDTSPNRRQQRAFD